MKTGNFRVIHTYVIVQESIFGETERFRNKQMYYFDEEKEYPELIKNITEEYKNRKSVRESIFDLQKNEQGCWIPYGYDDLVVSTVSR